MMKAGLLGSMRRTPYQTIGVVLSLSISFTVLFIFVSAILFLTKLSDYIKTQPQVSVYFSKATPQSEIFKLRQELMSTQKVRDVKYISQEQALVFYKQITRNEPILQEMATKESLPASLEVYALQPEYLEELAAYAKKNPGVESVEFQQDVVNNLIKVTNGITYGATLFLTAQFLIVFFLVFMTSTFKIMRRKDEIEILRLLGASRMFITKPLMQEGFLMNLLSVMVSVVLVTSGFLALSGMLNSFLFGVPNLTLAQIGPVAFNVWPINIYYLGLMTLVTLIVGNIVTTLATIFAASKYIS